MSLMIFKPTSDEVAKRQELSTKARILGQTLSDRTPAPTDQTGAEDRHRHPTYRQDLVLRNACRAAIRKMAYFFAPSRNMGRAVGGNETLLCIGGAQKQESSISGLHDWGR
jgi:hypothetical protein